MPEMTRKRESKLVRNPDGTFREWIGGREDNRDSSFRGLHQHNTADFKRQEGRSPRVGDVVRHENKDGSYHQQAMWYIRTENGWRRSPTERRKPTPTEIRRTNRESRRGGRR
jgi:hypothetical protein